MMKTKCSLILAAVVAVLVGARSQTAAAPVTFWFSGTVSTVNNPFNALPSGIAVGTPFSGRLTYDPAWISSSNSDSYPSGDTSNSYFTNTAGFSMLVQIGGHTILSAPNSEGYNCGYVGVYDQYNNGDSLTLETAHADLLVDGHSTRVGNQIPLMDLYLKDATKTAYASANVPTNAPTLNQFPTQRVFSWINRLDDGTGTWLFSIRGDITTLTTNELVTLNQRRTGDDVVQLGWPTAVSGYTLQSSTNLVAANWQTVTNAVNDANMEHTVTVSSASGNQFFRLKK